MNCKKAANREKALVREKAVCVKARTSMSAFHDGRLRDQERLAVTQHLAACPDCRLHERELRSVSLALREASRRRVPLDLTYRLRVIASHERARLLAGTGWWDTLRFRLNQILRPLAVPAAGGLFASMLSFALLAPNFTVHANTSNDVPVGLYTQVAVLAPSPFGFNGKDITVELTIDENGAVSDYSIPGVDLSKADLSEINNFILFTTFKAATAFGQPVSSKIVLPLRHIDVRS